MVTDTRRYALLILLTALVFGGGIIVAAENVSGEQPLTGMPGVVARGDPVTISGTATGNPNAVYVWVFGQNYRLLSEPVDVGSDGAYHYTLERSKTADLSPGRYYVIVQHPMGNGKQDVRVVSDSTISVPGGTTVDLSGLPANEAAAALLDALNSPNSDDTYVMVSFLIENPWIQISGVRGTGE